MLSKIVALLDYKISPSLDTFHPLTFSEEDGPVFFVLDSPKP